MWPFKSSQQKHKESVEAQYGAYLDLHGFEPEPEAPGRPAHLWGTIVRSQAYRLRLTKERGQPELFLHGAPLEPSGAWFEKDWYSIFHVVKRLAPGASLHPQWSCGPESSVLSAQHELLAHFFSKDGEAAREQFVRETTGRTPWPTKDGHAP